MPISISPRSSHSLEYLIRFKNYSLYGNSALFSPPSGTGLFLPAPSSSSFPSSAAAWNYLPLMSSWSPVSLFTLFEASLIFWLNYSISWSLLKISAYNCESSLQFNTIATVWTYLISSMAIVKWIYSRAMSMPLFSDKGRISAFSFFFILTPPFMLIISFVISITNSTALNLTFWVRAVMTICEASLPPMSQKPTGIYVLSPSAYYISSY